MRRHYILLTFIVVALAAPAGAGIRYRFDSVTTGAQNSRLTGVAESEGKSFRMTVEHGDGLLFRDGTIVLSKDGGATVTVVNPGLESYTTLNLDQLLGGATTLFKQIATLRDPKVDVRDAGDGGIVAGLKTTKTIANSSADIDLDVMGKKSAMRITVSSTTWATTEIPADAGAFLQRRTSQTGIDQLDKIIAAHTTGAKGFPLRQVTTVHIIQGSRDQATTTTTTVSGIERKPIAAKEFEVPAGYRKIENPIR